MYTTGVSQTHLFVLELDQSIVVLDNLVSEILGGREELGQAEPLPCHFVSVVCVDKLVVVYASYGLATCSERPSMLTWSITGDTFDCGLARVERDHVVDQSLTIGRERDGLGRIRLHVIGREGLTGLDLLAWHTARGCSSLRDDLRDLL